MHLAVKKIKELPVENKRIRLLETMIVSREADLREEVLFKQGRGQFHVASAGHEPLAVLAEFMNTEDWIYSHYRDRALMLARGLSLHEVALGYFAKETSSSKGRQMVSHFGCKARNIAESATPTALNCLPAAGHAWALKLQGRDGIVFCNIGDASTRQGEFFEAVAYSIQESLPIVFVIEDNGYGISTPTSEMNPYFLGMLPKKITYEVDGRDVDILAKKAQSVISSVREGHGPAILWIKLDRIFSHTGSDDQARYRSAEEIVSIKARDPIHLLKNKIISEGTLTEGETEKLAMDLHLYVKEVYAAAELQRPSNTKRNEIRPKSILEKRNQFRQMNWQPDFSHLSEWTLAQSVNFILNDLLSVNEKTIMMGEDIEDPKGGVFGLTKGLSTRYPTQVINAPLAEATIAGLAPGLATAGLLPIFELQFIDFIGPAFNQIVNQIATLKWRSAGQYTCPLIIYAPCGGYVGGGIWHSQTNEAWLTHTPGLKVFMASDGNSAVKAFIDAVNGEDPAIILLPKYQFQRSVAVEGAVDNSLSRVIRRGDAVTLVTWGNGVEAASFAANELEKEKIRVELIELISLAPCDWATIEKSVYKTGRLVVIQEDNRTSSFGQAIITEMVTQSMIWDRFYSPPALVSREDTYIGFNKELEEATLPNSSDIIKAVWNVLGQKLNEHI